MRSISYKIDDWAIQDLQRECLVGEEELTCMDDGWERKNKKVDPGEAMVEMEKACLRKDHVVTCSVPDLQAHKVLYADHLPNLMRSGEGKKEGECINGYRLVDEAAHEDSYMCGDALAYRCREGYTAPDDENTRIVVFECARDGDFIMVDRMTGALTGKNFVGDEGWSCKTKSCPSPTEATWWKTLGPLMQGIFQSDDWEDTAELFATCKLPLPAYGISNQNTEPNKECLPKKDEKTYRPGRRLGKIEWYCDAETGNKWDMPEMSEIDGCAFQVCDKTKLIA